MRNESSRYLKLLGIEGRPAGLSGLRDLVRQHITQVPFENISKVVLVGREGVGRMTTLREFLDGIERSDLGGTCYTSNPFFVSLLRDLGYDADLLSCDMDNPHVHTSIRVRLEGASFHVDVGYGAPFYEPISLANLPFAVKQKPYQYVFDRAPDRRLALNVFKGDARIHGYVVNEDPRTLDFFHPIILNSFRPKATFMNCLRVFRYFRNHSIELKNNIAISHVSGMSREIRICSMEELRQIFAEEFQMPRCPVEEAVETLQRLTTQNFFTMGEPQV